MSELSLMQEGGDNSEQYQAARDQTVNKYVIERPSPLSINPLKALIEAYKQECISPNRDGNGQFIDKLNFFMNTIDGEFLTLEQKLEAGGFSSDVALARSLKQNYGKTLQKIKHISSAQKVHAYLLGMVLVNFSFVYEYLSKTENRPDNLFIREVINVKVISPVEQLLNSCENALEVYNADIHAMIYYLTGNCHIKWN